jgi:hypothetical protein
MVFSLDFHTNDLTRNGGLFVSSFLERFLDRNETKQHILDPLPWWNLCTLVGEHEQTANRRMSRNSRLRN